MGDGKTLALARSLSHDEVKEVTGIYDTHAMLGMMSGIPIYSRMTSKNLSGLLKRFTDMGSREIVI